MNLPRNGLARHLPSQQWERNVYAILLAVFVAFSGFTVVMPFLPLYVRQLGVTDPGQVAIWSGLIFGVSPVLAGLMAPVWGSVADRYGRKPMFVRALVAFFFIFLLSAFVQNVYQMLALRALGGVFGGFGAMALAMVSTSAPEAEASKAIGRLQSVQFLTMASGPLFGGVLASTVGIRNTFFVSAAMYALALVAVVKLYKEEDVPKVEREKKEHLPLRQVLLLPNLLTLAVVLSLAQFMNRGLGPVLPLYVESLGMPRGAVAFWAGLIVSSGAVAAAVAAGVAGRLGSRKPLRILLLASLSGGIIASLLLAAVQNVPQLLAARVALGILAGGTQTVAFSLGSRLLPNETRGASFGFLSTGAMVGGGLSPFLAGGIAALNLRFVFLAGAVFYLVCSLIALRLPSPSPTVDEEEASETEQPSQAAAR